MRTTRKLGKRRVLVYLLLVMFIVFVPFNVPSFDGSQTVSTQAQSFDLPRLPNPQTWEQFFDLPRNLLGWVIGDVFHMAQWYVGSSTSWHGWLHPIVEPVYASTTDTVGSTANHASAANAISCSPIVASASGSLVSLGLNIQSTANGVIRMALYSTFSSNKLSGLLVDSGNFTASTGWNDAPSTGVTIVSGTTYYICRQTSSTTIQFYYASSGTQYFVAFTYAAFPDPTATLSTSAFPRNMRMIYYTSYSVIITQAVTDGNTVVAQASHSRSNNQAVTAGNQVNVGQFRTITLSNTSGYGNGSSFSNDATVGTVTWTNPSNAQTVDAAYATASASTTTDTIGSAVNNIQPVGEIMGAPITASASGSLTSIGVNIKVATSSPHIRLGLYSTLTGTPTFSGMMCQSNSTVAVVGWNDLAVSGCSVSVGVMYYPVIQADSSGLNMWLSNSNTTYYVAFGSYGSFPDPTGTLSSFTDTANMRITYFSATASQYLKALNFSTLNIPSSAPILGITVEITQHASAASGTNDNSLKLVKAGVISGNDKASGTAWGTGDATITYGSTSDTWGLSNLTGADINSSNFGVVLSVTTSGTASVDWIGISVTYSEPSFGFGVAALAQHLRSSTLPLTFTLLLSESASHLAALTQFVTVVNLLSEQASHLRTNIFVVSFGNTLSRIGIHRANLPFTVNFGNVLVGGALHYTIITQPFVVGITLMFFCAAGNTGSCGVAPQVIIQGGGGAGAGGVQPSLLGAAGGQPLIPLSTAISFLLVAMILASFFIGRFSREQPKRRRDKDGYEVVAS